MSFQVRLTLALALVAAIPLAILGYGVRGRMIARLDAEAAQRVRAVESSLAGRMSEQLGNDRRRLETLASGLAADNRFRIALAPGADRRWLLDWAPASMKLAGFAVLQVQDSAGRVLSSGHFRNEFDRIAPVVSVPSVMDARTPDSTVRALVAAATFTARGESFTVVGGGSFDSAAVASLSTDATVAALLVIGDSAGPEGARTTTSLPYVGDSAGRATDARIVLVADATPVAVLKADVGRWLAITLGGTLLAAALVATLLGRFISAPVTQLAERATKLERVAAMGDLARQVNHDIKNGLAPIRNVLRHLTQTAETEPTTLAAIYAERRATLDAGMEYLDNLARNYAKLSPALTRGSTDPRPVVRDIARGVSGATVVVKMPDTLPTIRTDAVVLQRILDNLVSNAVDALDGKPGTITIGAEPVGNGVDPRVRFTVTDTGRGMTRDELDRAFNDFYTTKASGTGLGLSVVRRLLTDVGGSVKADTAPGKGSTFTVEIPAGHTLDTE